MTSHNYENPEEYWDNRAKSHGLSSPGLAGTTANDKELLQTIDNIGQFATIVDFGCGTGRLYSTLHKHAKQYIGLDFSKEMLDLFVKNRQPSSGASLIREDLSVKFDDTWKDCWEKIAGVGAEALVCNMVIQHIVEPAKLAAAVANIKYLLRPGGTLYLHEAMLNPNKYPKFPHIRLRTVAEYQEMFKPEFDLQPTVSHVPYHTLLVGQKTQ